MNVTLKKAHTHGGVEHEAGAVIEVDAIEAAWLAEQHVIDAPPGKSGKVDKETAR